MACSVVQILRSLHNAKASLRTLGEVALRCDAHGDLIYNVGNSAVLVSFWHKEQWRTLKCYTSKSPRRKQIYGSKLLEEELYVPQEGSRGEWIDLLIDNWIEGVTLGRYVERCVEAHDREALGRVSSKFDALALELLSQEWAHGDLACENIIVDMEGGLHLIDLDAAFMPQFAGEDSVELGAAAFQHPCRTSKHFDRMIDDYSIALLSSALSLLALDVTLYGKFQRLEGLLFDPAEILDGRSEIYPLALNCFAEVGDALSYNIAKLLKSGSVELPNLYSLIRLKVEGLHPLALPTTIFRRDGLWGYLNEFGREAIPPLFDSALDFSESFAAVKLGAVWHYIDQHSNVVVSCKGCRSLKSVRDGVGRMHLEYDGWQEIEVRR